MPLLYSIANVFILPSLGEGWGRPHCEAMSMGLPIITTNWSGPTEYIKHMDNGLLIDIDGLQEIKNGSFSGHKWANPNVTHMQQLMRYSYENKETIKQNIGNNARNTMVNTFCVDCIGKILESKLLNISRNIKAKLNDNSNIHNEL